MHPEYNPNQQQFVKLCECGCGQPTLLARRIPRRFLYNHHAPWKNAAHIVAASRPLADRFWENVEQSPGCWEWTSGTLVKGYGEITTGGKTLTAHRVSWELAHGPIPEGMEVCHTCDNPRCVRPDHLFLGTHVENMRDAAMKGRFASRLTANQVREIRRLYADGGVTYARLAERFGVCHSNIAAIVTRQTWTHL